MEYAIASLIITICFAFVIGSMNAKLNRIAKAAEYFRDTQIHVLSNQLGQIAAELHSIREIIYEQNNQL